MSSLEPISMAEYGRILTDITRDISELDKIIKILSEKMSTSGPVLGESDPSRFQRQMSAVKSLFSDGYTLISVLDGEFRELSKRPLNRSVPFDLQRKGKTALFEFDNARMRFRDLEVVCRKDFGNILSSTSSVSIKSGNTEVHYDNVVSDVMNRSAVEEEESLFRPLEHAEGTELKRLSEMQSLENDMKDLMETVDALNAIVKEQADGTSTISKNTQSTVKETEDSLEEMDKAYKSMRKYRRVGLACLGAVLGAAVAGPVGALAGLNSLLTITTVAASGAGVGAVVMRKIT